MLLSTTGLSIPALPLTVNWSTYVDQAATVNVALLRADLERLAELVVADPTAYYGGYVRKTIQQNGLSVDLIEPVTFETRFVHAASFVVVPLATVSMQAPSYSVQMPITVQKIEGTFYESVLSNALAARVAGNIAAVLSAGPLRATYSARERQLSARYADLALQLDKAFIPTGVGSSIAGDITLATPGYLWSDPVARRVMNVGAVNTQVVNSIVANMPSNAVTAARNALTPIITDVLQDMSDGFSLNAVVARRLTSDEEATLASLAGSFFAMPGVILDVVGSNNRVLTVPAMIDTIRAIYDGIIARGGDEAIIDLDVSPRSLAEFVALVVPGSEGRFIESVEAFYRRKERPNPPAGMPGALRDAILTRHPLLIDEATVTGDRSVSFSSGGSTWTVEYPDLRATGYKLSPGASKVAAITQLQKVNAFLQSAFVALLGKDGVSPITLRNLGISGVQRGYAFAQNKQP